MSSDVHHCKASECGSPRQRRLGARACKIPRLHTRACKGQPTDASASLLKIAGSLDRCDQIRQSAAQPPWLPITSLTGGSDPERSLRLEAACGATISRKTASPFSGKRHHRFLKLAGAIFRKTRVPFSEIGKCLFLKLAGAFF